MSRPDEQRAVITGMGVMSGLGLDVQSFWAGLVAGRSCIRRWPDTDPRIASKIGGDLSDFSLTDHLRDSDAVPEALAKRLPKVLRGTPRGSQLAACAAIQAQVDADLGAVSSERVAHLCAGQNLSLAYFADNIDDFREHPDDIEPLLGMIALDTDIVGAICELLQLRGPSGLIGGACASGNLAAIAALDMIRSGRADAVLVTGAPFPTHPMMLHALTIIEATSFVSFNDAPTCASRPFDARREGFVQSEAAAAVVIESLASARRRGATPRAELLGGASASDASRLPKPRAEGQVRAIRGALVDAGLSPDDVDYVNAHATSTPLGDATEVQAIETALGARARAIPVNATKSMIGHAITSASVLELIATVQQLHHQTVHPTINLDEPSAGLELDFVPHVARPHAMQVALSNAFGFGGINSALAIGRWP